MVTVAQRSEKAPQPPSRPVVNEATVSMEPTARGQTDGPSPSIGMLTAQATLSVSQIQDLEEQIAALTKACVDYFGMNPTFSVRIEVQPKVTVKREHIEKVNEILGEVSGELQLG